MREPDNDLRVTALRIIETRRVFAESEFNWEICERVAREETAEDTLQMTKDFLSRGLEGSDAGDRISRVAQHAYHALLRVEGAHMRAPIHAAARDRSAR